MNKHNKIIHDQKGLVSIIVTLIIMIVLSLIVLGFANVSRREQRQSLDRQLTTQAYYAAETGISDAQKYIRAQLALPTPPAASAYTFTQCQPPSDFKTVSGINNVIDSSTSYSCVLVNPSPPELIWQRINPNTSQAFPFKPSGPNSEINFSWQDGDITPTTYGGCSGSVPSPPFPQQSGWGCQAGALRIDLTPVGGAVDRAGLIANTKNFILYPIGTAGTTSIAYASVDKGTIVPVSCVVAATPKHCNLKMTGLPAGNFFVRIRPVYRSAILEVAAQSGVTLTEAQAVIDVTGKANDILKRTQVRASISQIDSVSDNTTFNYPIESVDSLCKLYAIVPPSTVNNNDASGDSSCLP